MMALVLATAGMIFPAILLTARSDPAGIWKEKQRKWVKGILNETKKIYLWLL